MQILREAGRDPDLPDLDPSLQFIVNMLFEAGPISPAGDGFTVLSWQEIEAWKKCCGVTLAPWLARLIRRLSADYVRESREATAYDAPQPWAGDQTTERRERVSVHMKRLMGG